MPQQVDEERQLFLKRVQPALRDSSPKNENSVVNY